MINKKEKEQLYSIIGSYFTNGGETYSIDELFFKLRNDTYITLDQDLMKIISESVNLGFIYEASDGIYTR